MYVRTLGSSILSFFSADEMTKEYVCTKLRGRTVIQNTEIIAGSAFLVNLHTAMVCMFPPPHPLFPHLPRIFAPTACGSTPSPVGWEQI